MADTPAGTELAERVRQRCSGIGVLFTSGYNQDTIVRHSLMTDRLHFIGKPFTLQALAHKVREVLDEARAPGHDSAPSGSSQPA